MVISTFYYLPIFGVDISVKVYEDMESVGRAYVRFCKKNKLEIEPGNPSCRGMVIAEEDRCRINVWFSRKDLDLDLLTHECAHLTHAVLRFHNMNRKQDKEVYPLLNGYLNNVIAKKLKKKGINIG